jgi:hypothetical protein
MAMFPEANGGNSWRPPWRHADGAHVALVVATNGTEPELLAKRGVQVDAAVRDWLSDWLRAYRDRLTPADLGDEVTFLYALLTLPLPTQADGRVASDLGVLEAGFGSDPAGPEDSPAIPLEALLHRAIMGLSSE